jgi:hypothetical protein
MTNVLNERGWFWSSDRKLLPDELAPSNYVAGTITIDEDGRIEIDLEGTLSDSPPPLADLTKASSPSSRSICGILKSDNQYILACNAHRVRQRISGGICFESFSAQICLLSPKRLPRVPKIRAIKVNLAGFEEWLRLGKASCKTNRRGTTLKYEVAKDLRYGGSLGRASVQFNLQTEVAGSFGSRGSTIRPTAVFGYTPRKSVDLTKAIETYISIQDFLVVLTGSEYHLTWPLLGLTTGQKCTAYFQKSKGGPDLPVGYQCITSFPELQPAFGDLFFSWLKKREQLGPAFYLYLSTRRRERLYVEHRFTSLVSGLETFHRSLFPDCRSAKTDARLERIVADIQNQSDSKWLHQRTRHLSSPNLEQRLREILLPVSFNIERARLNAFCTLTAKLRNELFHTGKSQTAAATENSLEYLDEFSTTLAYLYHARIMMEIGVTPAIVERWRTNSSDAFRINWSMECVGLRPSTPTMSAPARQSNLH